MNSGLIPARYATALMDYAATTNMQKHVYQDAKTLVRHFGEFEGLRKVLDNPVLPVTEKRKIILTAAGVRVSKPFERFIDLILDNNRESYVQEIALKYVALYRNAHNIYSGKVTTATALDASTEKKLMSLVEQATGGTIEVEKVIDPEILGGFLFEVDFVRWDASVSGQLRRIRQEYIEKNKKTV